MKYILLAAIADIAAMVISLGTYNAFAQLLDSPQGAKDFVGSFVENNPNMSETKRQKALSILDQPDIILLSHRYNEDSFSDEIVGEVENNSTITYDKYDVNIDASFYDSAGTLVGSEQGFIDAESLNEGDRSAFNIFISDDAIRNEAVTYDLSINDERVVEGASKGGSSQAESDSEEDEE